MNGVRRADGLLSGAKTLALIGLLDAHPTGCQPEEVIGDLCAGNFASWSKSWNTLILLRDLGVFVEAGGVIRVDGAWSAPSTELYERIGKLTAKVLADCIGREGSRCLQPRAPIRGLWLDSKLLPRTAEGFPLWIIEFQVATRDRIDSRFWEISPELEELFWDAARTANRVLLHRAMTIAQLQEKLEENAADGLAAEEWVVAFERLRLASHPFVDEIKRVSDENVGAGFDVASFSTDKSLHHDLWIEVKSFSGLKRFFWSSNEVATARKAGEGYSLYLVDRDKMNEPGYEPQIINGPYSALFQSEDAGWNVEPDSYECTALAP